MIQTVIHLVILLGILWRISGTPYHFVLVQEQKNWEEAQSYCREKHFDLATVQSDEDRSMIQEAAAVNPDSPGWIGLYGGLSIWRWSLQNIPISFNKWESWEPDMGQTQEACAFLNTDGRWGATSCLEQRFFFCYNENSLIKIKFVKIRLSWHDAQQHCRTHYTDMATISDNIANAALKATIILAGEWAAWIGLFTNMWLWSDQTDVSWSSVRWIDTQPDNMAGFESCAFVRADGAMGDDICSVPRQFFCSAIRKQQTVRLAMRVAEGLDEPTVTAAIEEKIYQMLSEQGMDADLNVTLRVFSDGTVFKRQENAKQQSMQPCED